MPARLPHVAAETVARRLELRPGTVTLDALKDIYTGLGEDALTDGHSVLKVEAFAMAAAVQELIETPEPSGLAASARLIVTVDDLIVSAYELRTDVAGAYDRFDKHTARATEAVEILTAIGVKLEAADLELRTGTRAA
jgi:hypothetical protein